MYTEVVRSIFVSILQALIGIAFSIGFVFGPTIGAMFSHWTRDGDNDVVYVIPALFALVLAVADIIFVYVCLGETLPKEKRVGCANPVFFVFFLLNKFSI